VKERPNWDVKTSFTHLPGDDVVELVMTDFSFTNKLKTLSFIPSTGQALEPSDLSGVSSGPPHDVITQEFVSIATSATACSKSGIASSLSKCRLRAISRFPLQALKSFIVAT